MSLILGILDSGGAAAGGGSSYESIATVTVGSGGQASIEFTSIPADYTHLQIRGITGNVTSGNASSGVYYAANSDTTNGNYKSHALYGDGGSVTASAGNRLLGLIGATSGYNAYVIDILDYKNTNKYKTVRSLSGFDQNGYGFVWFGSSVWMNTNAITSLTFNSDGGNFLQYSQLALYGVKS
jgi:hypothetical protein